MLGAFQRRIDKLSDKSRQALALAAILEPGPEFNVPHWAALLGHEMPDQDVEQVLKEGLKQRLIRNIGHNRYAFRPADISKALAATLTGTRRAELHQRLAGLLQQSGADPLLVGHHHEQGGSPQTAAQFLEAAGAKAMAKDAINAALSYYNRATTLNPSATAYRAIGRINRQQGNHDEAIEAYEKTLIHVQTLGDAAEEANVLNSLSLTYCLNDQLEKAQRHAENVLKLDSASAASRAIAKSQLGLILWRTGHLAEAESWCQQAIQSLAGTEHPTQLAEAYSQLGIVYRSQGQFKKARLAWQNAQKIYGETSDQVGIGQVLNHLGHLATEMSNFEQAAELLKKALEIFKQHNARDGDLLVYLNEGRLLIYQQRPDKALPYLTKALDLAREINKHSAYIIGEIYRLMAQAMLGSGDVDRAKSAADDAHQLATRAGHRELAAQADLILAQIYQAQNNLTAAAAMFKNGLDLFRQVGSRPGVVRAKWHSAQFLRRQGQTAEAARLQGEAEVEAEAMRLYLY